MRQTMKDKLGPHLSPGVRGDKVGEPISKIGILMPFGLRCRPASNQATYTDRLSPKPPSGGPTDVTWIAVALIARDASPKGKGPDDILKSLAGVLENEVWRFVDSL